MKKSGYTLVELLVVVAIIAILFAMIAPVLMQAKEAARMRCCADNLKQLGHAIQRYMDDHDGYGLPAPPTPSDPPNDKNYTWTHPWVLWPEPLIPRYIGQSIAPYKNPPTSPKPYHLAPEERVKLLWFCPGDTIIGTDRPCWWWFGSSYLYPGPTAYLRARDPRGAADPVYRKETYPLKPGLWKNPKRNILLADFWADFHTGTRAQRWTVADARSLHPALHIKTKSINVIFLDLHIQAVTPEERREYETYTTSVDNPYELPPRP